MGIYYRSVWSKLELPYKFIESHTYNVLKKSAQEVRY
jgi:hypothetical protein